VSHSNLPRIYLYDGVNQPWFAVSAVRDHLAHWLPGAELELREDPLVRALAATEDAEHRQAQLTDLAHRLCQSRVFNPARALGESRRRPLKPELDYESRLLTQAARAAAGIVYDGDELECIALGLLPQSERRLDTIHIWFTERLFATWDADDRRYHARVSLYGLPSIVSTSGMVHAPARERAHYLAQRLGLRHAAAATGDFLDHEDPRSAEVAKGYAMQAVFYALTGEPFCDDPQCRLFNAHWQREMLAAQLTGEDYCCRHREILEGWRTAFADRKEEALR